jgi:hypothetical protein
MSEEKKPKQVTINNLREAETYLKKISADADRGIIDRELFPQGKMEEGVTSATEPQRLEYLNYCISLVPDKYMKHKILLFLRVNPFRYVGDRGQYLSVAEIARCLRVRCGIHIQEHDVRKVEAEAIRIVQDTLAKTKANAVALVGSNRF